MFSQKQFFVVCFSIFVLFIFLVAHYFFGHSDNGVGDGHIHHIYFSGSKENPNELYKVENKTYGIPKEDVEHRHTGADYVQHGIVTWKHVNDQHEKIDVD